MAKTKTYKVKVTHRGALPFLVSDSIGVDNYNKLQNNQSVKLPAVLPVGINEFLEEDIKPKRARNTKGQLKADDPSTPNVNEAYEGGKGPKKKGKK
tara:strand:+ start:1433 stop:1720 length:288 start_codon:yes stop_codon:yes gene_type:complete